MEEYAKLMSSELVRSFSLYPLVSFWTPRFKIKSPEDSSYLKNALKMPHEILKYLKPQDNIGYSPAYNSAFLQSEIKQRH